MHASLKLRRDWRCWVAGAVLILVAVVEARALELTGDYVDGGRLVAADTAPAIGEPSLYALLSLEFDPRVVAVRRAQTSNVRLTHEADRLLVEVCDLEGVVMWTREWKENEDYVRSGEGLVFRFRLPQLGRDEIILVMESVTTHGLLQVTAQRITPTLLGPMVRKLGIYLFHRMP